MSNDVEARDAFYRQVAEAISEDAQPALKALMLLDPVGHAAMHVAASLALVDRARVAELESLLREARPYVQSHANADPHSHALRVVERLDDALLRDTTPTPENR